MAQLSDTYKHNILDYWFGTLNSLVSSSVSVGLIDTSGNEFNVGGYSRQLFTFYKDTPTYKNTNDVIFGPSTESWPSLSYLNVYDNSNTVIFRQTLSGTTPIINSNNSLVIKANAIKDIVFYGNPGQYWWANCFTNYANDFTYGQLYLNITKTKPSLYLALSTDTRSFNLMYYGTTLPPEPSDSAYSRIALSSSDFTFSDNDTVKLNNDKIFNKATEDWGEINSWFITDGTGVLVAGDLDVTLNIYKDDIAVVSTNDLVITF